MKQLFGIFLLFAAICTYVTCLIGNVMIGLYLNSTVASLFGLMAMATVIGQLVLAVKNLRDN